MDRGAAYLTEGCADTEGMVQAGIVNSMGICGTGFEDNGTQLYDVESMTICNWVQFRGNWSLHHVDIMTMTALQTIFENGVRFWHYKEDGNKQNPMLNDIYENVYK
jgi:hypothetical protein